MKRTRRTQEQWLAIHQDWKQSGLSAPVYCQKAGVSYQSFQNFRHKLKTKDTPKKTKPASKAQTFIDLSQLADRSGSNKTGWIICLRLGNGVELELSQQR